VWVAIDDAGEIRGHVDLRGHPLQFTGHRCLLGMGVHRAHRQQGLAMALLAHAIAWASAVDLLEWMDLQVLATNSPAIALYRKAGFVQTGDIPDMFRIDGLSIGDVAMSLRLRPAP
jgi:ribosomal protein S18 acetylase RimI-like enzyme